MNRTLLPVVAALAALSLGVLMFPSNGFASPHQGRGDTVAIRGGVVQAIDHVKQSATIIKSFECKQEDVRDALRRLMAVNSTEYSIAPEVQGTITLTLRNVTFESALAYMLRQVDATYRIEGGVLMITPLLRTVEGDALPPPPTPRSVGFGETLPPAPPADDSTAAAVVVQDTSYLYVVRGFHTYKIRKSDMTTVARGVLPRGDATH